MKKLTKTEKTILSLTDKSKYDSYICPEHGLFMIRVDLKDEEKVCPFCKKACQKLSKEEIEKALGI